MSISPRPLSRANHACQKALRLLGLSLAFLAGSGCRAQQSWPLWQHYTERMIDPQGRVVDHTAGDRTTSEGQSYALFFALVANDRSRFDKLLAWTESNLADGDLSQHLPAWSWGKAPNGSWQPLDQSSASDSDLWIAYDLLEAGRLWREPRFEQLGRTLLLHIAQREVVNVPGLGVALLPGPVGFHPDPQTWLLNPSYLPLPVLQRLAAAQPEGPWAALAASLLPLLRQGSGAGYAMDWVSAGTTIQPSPAPAQLASAAHIGVAVGSYEAIRTYLWLGLANEHAPNRRELLAQIPAMATYLKANNAPPETVDASGIVVSRDAPPGFSAAVVPYLEALGLHNQAAALLARLAATQDPASGLFGPRQAYYDQNLILFATGWAEQRFRFDPSGRLVPRWK